MTGIEGARLVELACARLLGRPPTNVALLSEVPRKTVHRATVSDDQTVIVKLYQGAAAWKALRERRAIEAVAASACSRTAKVLAHGSLPDRDVSALIISDLGSRSLGRVLKAGDYSRSLALNQLGELLADFHELPSRLGAGLVLPTFPMTFASQLSELGRVCSNQLLATVGPTLRLADALCRLEKRSVWCHGDLHPENIMLVRAPTGELLPHLIDFEQLIVAVPEYDIAQTLVTSDALAPTERARVTDAYGTGISPELLGALIVFHTIRGWVYAADRECRDRRLWARRVLKALDPAAVLLPSLHR